jgi:predicted Rossmann fold flavoprotein
MAAIFAARGGAETLLLERTADGGRKILISGGGRCNVLPLRLDESRFITDSSPNVMRKMIRAWPLAEQVAFFEQELGIPLVEEVESSKRFPASHRARDVRDGLLAHAASRGATLVANTTVTDVAPDAGRWRIEREHGDAIIAEAVIIATGGLSVPNTGSDGCGLRLLARLGHEMQPTYPALTPITASDADFAALSGISLPVTLTARDATRGATAAGGFLFTHRGYSGPSVLDVSHVVVRSRLEGNASATISVRWSALGEEEWTDALRPQGARTVTGALRLHLPERLVAALLARAGVDAARSLADLRRDERQRLVAILTRGELPWNGDEGYKKAEVTGGGVALGEVDPRTMESRRQRGLFICGEVLDAFGPIGGYNFLWAWATGRAAGTGAAAARDPAACAAPPLDG